MLEIVNLTISVLETNVFKCFLLFQSGGDDEPMSDNDVLSREGDSPDALARVPASDVDPETLDKLRRQVRKIKLREFINREYGALALLGLRIFIRGEREPRLSRKAYCLISDRLGDRLAAWYSKLTLPLLSSTVVAIQNQLKVYQHCVEDT